MLPGRDLLHERAYSLHDIPGSLPVLDDLVECLPGLFEIWRPATQPPQSGLGIVNCRIDRLICFMCDRGRQLPHCRDAIYVRELRLRFTECFRGSCQLDGPLTET